MKKVYILMAALFVAFSCGENKPSAADTTTPATDTKPEPEPDPQHTTLTFAKGADISWASEMVAGGRKFYKKDGSQAALLDVLKDCGINAIRLRVWVNPYKGWSGKEDVLAVAGQVKSAGMALMIDFHYSDFFADPGRQLIPSAWQADQGSMDKMCQHVADHTKDVLQALKDAGVTVTWIQVGNETRNGMLSPLGDAKWNNSQIDLTNFVKLYNAGYDAAKSIYPSALVMPHLNSAFFSADYGNPMWLNDFRAKGGKFDMIAFSHYPQMDKEEDRTMWVNGNKLVLTPAQMNQYALAYIKSAAATYNVPVMVSEVGVKLNNSESKELLQSFMTEVKKIEKCAGVFYWEPQVDGVWKPAVYSDAAAIQKYTGKYETWSQAYNMGAFTTSGKPTSVMDVFSD